MGGHGALTVALKNPDRFRSVSAFSPIAASMKCSWGVNAFSKYLGEDREAWREYDACALMEDGKRVDDILFDQGTSDEFLEDQLKPDHLERACEAARIPLTLRRQEGYDHSYFFIASFIADHIAWAFDRL